MRVGEVRAGEFWHAYEHACSHRALDLPPPSLALQVSVTKALKQCAYMLFYIRDSPKPAPDPKFTRTTRPVPFDPSSSQASTAEESSPAHEQQPLPDQPTNGLAHDSMTNGLAHDAATNGLPHDAVTNGLAHRSSANGHGGSGDEELSSAAAHSHPLGLQGGEGAGEPSREGGAAGVHQGKAGAEGCCLQGDGGDGAEQQSQEAGRAESSGRSQAGPQNLDPDPSPDPGPDPASQDLDPSLGVSSAAKGASLSSPSCQDAAVNLDVGYGGGAGGRGCLGMGSPSRSGADSLDTAPRRPWHKCR